MNFFSKVKSFRRKWPILVGVPVLAVLFAYYFVLQIDKRYKSTAQLATGFTTDDAVKLSESSSNPFDVSTNFNNVIESMNSVPVLTLVSYRLMLHDLENENTFREFNAVKADITVSAEALAGARAKFSERLETFKPLNLFNQEDRFLYAVLKGYGYDHESLAKNLSIQRLTASDFIVVEYISEDPFLSALTVNAVCQEFIRYNKDFKTDRSSESIEFLEAQVREKKKVLDEKNLALNDYKSNNNVFNYDAETKSKIALITDYELNKERELKNLNALQLSLQQVTTSIDTKTKATGKLNQQEVVTVNQRIVELKDQINNLNASGAESNKAKVQRLRDELQLETSRLEALSGNKAIQQEIALLEKERDDLKLKAEIAQANLNTIDESIKKLRRDVTGFSSKQANAADFEREAQLASTEYINAQDKFNAAKNKSMVIGSSIRQILEGQPSYQPEPTNAVLWLTLIGVGSLLLCFVGIALWDVADVRIRIASRLEKFTGLRSIGSINLLKNKDFNLREIFNDRNANAEYETFSHFLRKLRYEIQASEGKVFLITSTQRKVGKSFLIVSLSYALSLVNKRVLIIDTNFRHNSLTKALMTRANSHKMLKKVLDDDDEVEGDEETSLMTQEESNRAMSTNPAANKGRNIISKTKYTGVDIIGNVGGRDSPSEILAGRDFKDMIRNLALQYDCVLMEGPSLNEYSDTKELIDFADKVIPVFSAETSLNHFDRDSIKYFKSIDSKLMGTVLNRVELKYLNN